MREFTTAVAIALLLTMQGQQPIRDTASVAPAIGTARIAGIVVTDETTRQPVRNARVTLNSAQNLGPGRTVSTADDGQFAFDGLPAGRFRLAAAKPGFLSATYGATQPDRMGTPVTVDAGQHLDLPPLRMSRGGVITGRVIDSAGQPAAGVSVGVLRSRYSFRTGGRTLVPETRDEYATTDDQGMYREWGLLPGDYVVMAKAAFRGSPSGYWLAAQGVRQFTPAELQRALRPPQSGNSGAALPTRPAVSLGESAGSVAVAFAPVYFPGTTDPFNATSITLALGEERAGVDLQLQRVPAARLDGVVTMSDGAAAGPVEIRLSRSGAQADLLNGFGSRLVDDRRLATPGPFSFTGVMPGSYTVLVRTIADLHSSELATARTMWASADVTADGRDMSVALDLRPGMTFTGRIVLDGTQAPPNDLASWRVGLVAFGEWQPRPGGEVDRTGKFTITGLTPGRYDVQLPFASATAGSAPIWRVRSCVITGRGDIEGLLDLKGGENLDVTVTYTDRPPELSGILRDTSGRPAPDYTILVFPADRSRWMPASRRFTMARPATDGAFTFAGLPAGDYLIAALIGVDNNEWYDPRFLETLVPKAITVTLVEGQKIQKDLRIGGQ